jgi:hypothetical protein
MRRHLRWRPQVETLEAISLLSTGAASLAGTARGTFFAHRGNPQTGTVYNLFASGKIAPVGRTLVLGGFQTVGFTARGAGGGNFVFSIDSPGGVLGLRVNETAGPAALGPDQYQFRYQVVQGATSARGRTGTLDLTLAPARFNVQGKPVTNPGFFGNATLSFS